MGLRMHIVVSIVNNYVLEREAGIVRVLCVLLRTPCHAVAEPSGR
jgi:hypothetical protein